MKTFLLTFAIPLLAAMASAQAVITESTPGAISPTPTGDAAQPAAPGSIKQALPSFQPLPAPVFSQQPSPFSQSESTTTLQPPAGQSQSQFPQPDTTAPNVVTPVPGAINILPGLTPPPATSAPPPPPR